MAAVDADLLADFKGRPTKTIVLAELDLPTTRGYSEAWAAASARLYEGLLVRGGQITRSVSDSSYNLPRDTARVQIWDKDRDLEKVFLGSEVGAVSGSAARIKIASRTQAESKWFTVFAGVIESFNMPRARLWDITLKRDDKALQGLVNIDYFQRYDWLNLPTASIGLPSQAVYGRHNSGATSVSGMVAATYVDDVNFRYAASMGPLTSIPNVYSGGTLKTVTTDYTINTAYFNRGKWWTIITFVADQGTNDVTFDCEGLSSGGLIQNQATQLEHFLTNFVFGDWRNSTTQASSAWLSASDYNIDETFFAETETFFSNKQIAKGSRVITAGTRGIDVLNEWTKQFQVPSFWTYDGKIAVRPDDHCLTDTYIDAPHLRQEISPAPSVIQVSYDASRLVDEVSADFLYAEADGAFQDHLTVKDSSKGYGSAVALPLHWRESQYVE